MFSLLIKNAVIYDGAGNPPFKGDVGIKEDKIVSIGGNLNSKSRAVLDATGLWLTPGFIDLQNHSDSYWRLLENPGLDSSVLQGFTTVVVGNCGASLAPLLSRQALLSVRKWHDVSGSNVSWQTFTEYAEAIAGRGLGSNVASLVGLSTLRRGALGDEVRALSDQELKMLGEVLRKSLTEGAFGLSTGLSYSHELNIDDRELDYMLGIVREHNGLFGVHLRNEAANIVESVEHVVRLAEKNKVRLKISHLKVRGEKYWPLIDQVLTILENAYHRGVEVYFDIYPYDTLWQPLYSYLPKWSVIGGRTQLLRHLADVTQRRKILDELHSHHTKFEELILSSTANKLTTTGKKLSSIAASHGLSSEETVLELVEKGGSEVLVFDRSLSQEQIWRLSMHPLGAVATDGSGFEVSSKTLVHPRCFGTTAKFLRYVLDNHTNEIPLAVHKLSGLPAKILGIENRGVIREKAIADLCLIDPEKIKDNATLTTPAVPSSGIPYVLCGGQVQVSDGKLSRIYAGQFLKS